MRGVIDISSIWIVIAAYNEVGSIGDVVRDVRKVYQNVVVIDDGSDDGTFGTARSAGAVVIRHPINLGQGAALQTGIDFSLRRGAGYIVTFDADGQHQIDDISTLLEKLVESGADIACGSRFLGQVIGAPRFRRIVLRMAAIVTRLTTGLHLTDAHNGLRAMTRACAYRIRIRQNRMAHASEIINQVARNGLKIIEVPVTIVYSEYSIQKGQKLSGAIRIVIDLAIRKFYR